MNQSQPEKQNNIGPSSNCDLNRPIWRSVLLQGNVELLSPLFKDGFTADSPVCNRGRHPLIDLCLETPTNNAHAEALAETARALINAGATLNIPDYKGLIPADYALSSPNKLIATQVILATMRDKINNGLKHAYTPQIDVLFSTAMCKPERQKLYANITRNLDLLRKALSSSEISNDPLLLEQDYEDILFWQNMDLKDFEEYPTETSAMREQFRRIASMTTADEPDEYFPPKQVVSAEQLEKEHQKYRILEFKHAQRFYI